MSNGSKVTITVASEQAVQQLRSVTSALHAAADAQARLKGGASGGQPTTAGAPPPAPTGGFGQPFPGTAGAPPPAPTAAGTGTGGTGSGGAAPSPSPGGGGAGSAPPPPPGGGGDGGGGAPPPSPGGGGFEWPGKRKPTGPDDSFVWNNETYVPSPSGGWRKAPKDKPPPADPTGLNRPVPGSELLERVRSSAAGQVLGGVGRGVSMALGFGMGTSLTSLPFEGSQRYAKITTDLREVEMRFRNLGDAFDMTNDKANRFGENLGYTITQAAEMAKAMGSISNTFDGGAFADMLGLARLTGFGANPSAVFQPMGRMIELAGPLDNDQIVGRMGMTRRVAHMLGMEQGRYGELLQRLQQQAEMEFRDRGEATAASMAAVALPALVFNSADPRRANNTTLVPGLDQALHNQATRALLMRSSGYGVNPNVGYLDVMEQIEGGINDPRNLVRLMTELQGQGAKSEQEMVIALQGLSGGSLKIHELRPFVRRMMGTLPGETRTGLQKYQSLANMDEASARLFLAEEYEGGLDPSVAATATVTPGERQNIAVEKALYSIGEQLSTIVIGLGEGTATIADLVAAITNLINPLPSLPGSTAPNPNQNPQSPEPPPGGTP